MDVTIIVANYYLCRCWCNKGWNPEIAFKFMLTESSLAEPCA